MTKEEEFQRIWLQQFITFYPDAVVHVSLSGIDLSGLDSTTRHKLVTKLKQQHWVKGIQDVTIYLPDKVINMEWKRPDGKGVMSEFQKEIKQKLLALGHNYYLIDSNEKAWACIKENTTVEYRRRSMEKLISTLNSPKITEPFLMFQVGTATKDIVEILEEKYQLKD